MMSDYDEEANNEADRHAQMMQKQRNKKVVNSLLKTMIERGLIKEPNDKERAEMNKDDNNEISD